MNTVRKRKVGLLPEIAQQLIHQPGMLLEQAGRIRNAAKCRAKLGLLGLQLLAPICDVVGQGAQRGMKAGGGGVPSETVMTS